MRTKIWFSLFGLLFAGIGVVVFWLFLRDAMAGMKTLAWRKTECVITASSVRPKPQDDQSSGDFSFEVKYRYTVGGEQFTSDQYERNPTTFEDYGEAARLVEKYSAGSSAICYVNSAAPGQALLVRYNLFSLLLVLFPLLFIAFGGAILYAAWGGKSPRRPPTAPISDQAVPGRGRWASVVVCSLFLLGGGAAFYAFSIQPAFELLGARAWPAVPCVVISSEVSNHGRTCSINILYSYEFNGRAFKSNAYDLMGGSSSGSEGKEAVVARFPPGTKTVCYVNPEEPTEAVLKIGFSPDIFFGLIPLLFFLIGASGLVWTVRSRPRSAPPCAEKDETRTLGSGAWVAAPPDSAGGVGERVLLKPTSKPWFRLLGAVFFCLFANGIISVGVVQTVKNWPYRHAWWLANVVEWFMAVFLVPFVWMGLKLFGKVVYCVLALFNPRPQLTILRGPVRLGGNFQVHWNLAGRAGGVQDLRLRLLGREEASSGSGRRRDTAASVFAMLEIARATTPETTQAGEASVTIPDRLVPSFAGKNNEINWYIQVLGKTAWGPDVSEAFPVTVLPSAPAARQSL
jgi:hypothetical protein